MIGAIQQGYDVPIWMLIIVSSTLFGFGHSAQGRVGMVMTAILSLIMEVSRLKSRPSGRGECQVVNLSEFVYTS
jgi:membrane protease YdiL (CAAX protease family)